MSVELMGFYLIKEKNIEEWSISSNSLHAEDDSDVAEFHSIKYEIYKNILLHFGAYEENGCCNFKNYNDAKECVDWLKHYKEIGFSLNYYTKKEILQYLLEQEIN